MTLKVWITSDMPSDHGGTICATVVAHDEEEARFLLEKDLKNDNVSTTDRFNIPLTYTMTCVKMHRTSVHVLSYGDEH